MTASLDEATGRVAWSFNKEDLRRVSVLSSDRLFISFKAFSPRTRIIIVNTPHNPTGQKWENV